MSLVPFRKIPEDEAEWARWITAQVIPAPVSDSQLSGSKTLRTQDFALVKFDSDEDNASYHVSLNGATNETFWVTQKKVTGFRLNSSNGTSTATVSWLLFR